MNAFVETSEKCRDFFNLCALKMQAAATKNSVSTLAESTAPGALRVSNRVVSVAKSAVSPGKLSDATYAGNLSDYHAIAEGFISSLQNVGVFDRMLVNGMKRLPFRTRVAVVTSAATGSQPAEAALAPITQINLAGDTVLDPKTVLAILVLSNELVRFATPGTVDLLGRELRTATVKATDSEFLTGIMSGITGIGSAGSQPGEALADFRTLLDEVTIDSTSRLFFVMPPLIAKQLSFLPTSADHFSDMGPTGGVIRNIPALVSDALSAGTILLVDATGIAGATDTITIDTATQGALKMDTVPGSGGQQLVSLFQTNSTALKAFRYFGYDRLRDSAVAFIEGASYDNLQSEGV